HVMERESFESDAIAALMNERFVCVKVDREERPDVDDIYMTATQIMTGRGGWPMSAFLEPEGRRPFFCGTYFPPRPHTGMPSFPQVLEHLSDAWRSSRNDVLAQATEVASAVQEALGPSGGSGPVPTSVVADAVQGVLQSFDRVNGGFGGAPKFPQPAFLSFLLTVRPLLDATTIAACDQVVRTTLDRMLAGGIHDQIGGGFHRYAVDAHWIVPHFEKMLYDNAQLAEVYARAAALYDDAEYRRVARRTIHAMRTEMRDDGGGFHSAEDAEVDHREGLNYLWTPDEVRDLLGDEAPFATSIYGLDAGPNFRDPHHPGDEPRNVLRLAGRLDRTAA
ncbi:MAG: thioredoxin domain-containing protein, partial [Phycisphaerales bacterium]|nr:thioredoxin domain-containing protein [Phycisphaerales bacterium]